MLSFKKLTLDDIDLVRPYFSYSANKTCDNTVGCTFMWRDYFSTQYALENKTLVFKVDYYDTTAFTYPLGDDVSGALEKIEDYCDSSGIPLKFCAITKNELQILKTVYCNMRIWQESGWSDYLYNASDLINLTGKKFHGQRNHINSFKRLYSGYTFEVIDEDNIGEVIVFFGRIKGEQTKDSGLFRDEQENAMCVLENYAKYGLPGGFIRVDGDVAAFSVGEVLGDVLFVHVEKADLKYKGIYQVINNEFAQRFVTDGVKYINREEDDGDMGLRISKQSYHPIELIEKYVVEVQC